MCMRVGLKKNKKKKFQVKFPFRFLLLERWKKANKEGREKTFHSRHFILIIFCHFFLF